MYAAAAARSDGLLLLCGGRDASGAPLGDAYGLARHRDGRWEWAVAPGQMPTPRYQHSAVFVQAKLHVSGGAIGGGRMVDESSSITMLDTGTGTWSSQQPATNGNAAAHDLMKRCRHAVAAIGTYVFIYGGLRGSTLLDDMLLVYVPPDDADGPELAIYDPRSPAWCAARVWRAWAAGEGGWGWRC